MDRKLSDRLERALEKREAAGLNRSLSVYEPSDAETNLADNDYFGLSTDPRVKRAAQGAIERVGCSASASPLVTGFRAEHAVLLDELKDWHGFRHGIVWNSGYAANSALLACLPHPGDLVLADRAIHRSMVEGILRSGARLQRYRHCDLDHLESLLERHADGNRLALVVTESVFSMDGDYPDLDRMAELKRRFGFVWILDEAHALGWYGPSGAGLAEAAGLVAEVDAFVGTLGKALGSMGAYTLFHDELLERYCVNFASEFIYSTYLPPACAAAARASVRILRSTTRLQEEAQALSRRVRAALIDSGFEVPIGDSPIVPIGLGDPSRSLAVASALRVAGYRVGAIRPPTVPEGTSRLRLSLKHGGDDKWIAGFVAALRRAASEEGVR